jgi:hypothetical protein
LLKERLARLGPVVQRAMKEAEERTARRQRGRKLAGEIENL